MEELWQQVEVQLIREVNGARAHVRIRWLDCVYLRCMSISMSMHCIALHCIAWTKVRHLFEIRLIKEDRTTCKQPALSSAAMARMLLTHELT